MSNSFTSTESTTFTITHARKIATKVGADLKRMQRYYGDPTDDMIEKFEEEIAILLRYGGLKTVIFGFKKKGVFIDPTLKYEASELTGYDDEIPGKVNAYANIEGARFSSYLVYSDSWYCRTIEERNSIEKDIPINRTEASMPETEGYYVSDKSYSSGGKGVNRSTLKKL